MRKVTGRAFPFRQRAAFTIAPVLLVMTIAFISASILATSSFSHVTAANTAINAQTARNLADSAVSLVVSRLQVDPNYGRAGQQVEVTLPGAPPGAFGFVTFTNLGRYREVDVVPSTHNYRANDPNAMAVTGSLGRRVPGGAVDIVATGICGGVRQCTEALVHFPNFSFAVACGGRLRTRNATVAAVRTPNDVQRDASGNLYIPADRLRPGSVACNFAGSDAMVLGAGTTVSGDAQAVGDIQLDQASVKGDVRPHWEPALIADINYQEYEDKYKEIAQPLPAVLVATEAGGFGLQGFCRRDGDLDVQGGVRLDGGVLLVNGNLRVQGGIRGQGAVFVKGSAAVDGVVNLTSDDVAALVTGGDVVLTGGGKKSASFQGLVYCKGNFHAERITLLGAFIARSTTGTMTLENADVLHTTLVGSKLEVFLKTVTFSFGADKSANYDPITGNLVVNGTLKGLGPNFDKMPLPGPKVSGGYPDVSMVGTEDMSRIDNGTLSLEKQGDGSYKLFYRWMGILDEDTRKLNVLAWDVPTPGTPAFDAAMNRIKTEIRNMLIRYWDATSEELPSGVQMPEIDQFFDKLFASLRPAELDLRSSRPVNFTFDPNQFIQVGDRMRILLWRQF